MSGVRLLAGKYSAWSFSELNPNAVALCNSCDPSLLSFKSLQQQKAVHSEWMGTSWDDFQNKTMVKLTKIQSFKWQVVQRYNLWIKNNLKKACILLDTICLSVCCIIILIIDYFVAYIQFWFIRIYFRFTFWVTTVSWKQNVDHLILIMITFNLIIYKGMCIYNCS